MAIARLYQVNASAGKEGALKDALVELAAKVRRIDSCRGVELYQDWNVLSRFIFIEHWASIEAHRAGGALLGKQALEPVMAVIEGLPEASYIERVEL